jgi:alpha-L-fucosidase 2
MPTVMGIHGEPLGGWVQYSYTLVGQAWSAFAFYEYWKCTAREDFLRERAYPYLRMSAECALRWLAPDTEGWLRLPLSCSPEIHDDKPEAWMRPDTNNDLALLKFLFGALAEMAAALGDPEEARWKETLSKIGPYHLEKNGGLMVSADEALTESHRHFGHAMGLHPLRLLDVVGDPSARRTLDATVGRLERLGSGNWIGFSFAWMASLYALQGNGEGAAHQLRTFEECICSPNGFHLNGDYRKRGVTHFHYRPFTLESNMGAACAVQDMLLDAAHGRLRPFPATPAAWRGEGARVAFEDLRAEGGLQVSAELTNGTLSYMVIRAEKDADLLFENVFPTDSIRIEIDGKEVRRTACRPGETFALRLEKGRACRLSAG